MMMIEKRIISKGRNEYFMYPFHIPSEHSGMARESSAGIDIATAIFLGSSQCPDT
jgi:hypothetical protein